MPQFGIQFTCPESNATHAGLPIALMGKHYGFPLLFDTYEAARDYAYALVGRERFRTWAFKIVGERQAALLCRQMVERHSGIGSYERLLPLLLKFQATKPYKPPEPPKPYAPLPRKKYVPPTNPS